MMEANGKVLSRLKGKKVTMLIMSFAVLSLIAGYSVYETTKAEVTLSLDGEERNVKSHAETVSELLDQENIDVNKHDIIEPGLEAAVKDGMKITWKPAKQVTLTVNGKTKTTWTTGDTVKDVLEANGVTVQKHDKIEPSLSTAVTEGMNVSFESAFEIPLIVGGKEQNVWTTSTTVADLLKQQRVKLNELDRVEPGLDEKVTPDMKINVMRVEKVTDVVEETVDYATVTRKDNSLEKGTEKVLQSGKNGKVKKYYEVTLENGEETNRKLVKEETLKESENRIVAVGTKEITRTVSRAQKSEPESSPSSSGGKTLYMASTAYTANCSGCSGRTATGINLKANPNVKVIAVDPSVIPLGTKVHVEGYGYAIAADTGGSIKGHKIDVFFPSKSQAYSWGTRNVRVKILD